MSRVLDSDNNIPSISDGTRMLLHTLQDWSDDTSKLIYADYLESELGQQIRANLIRTQCSLAAWGRDNLRDYNDPTVDCRNIKPSSKAGTDDICECPPEPRNVVKLCQYHEIKEYEKDLLQSTREIVGSTIMNLMPSSAVSFHDYSTNNFGVPGVMAGMIEGTFTPSRFNLEKGLVVGLTCPFEFWIMEGVDLLQVHPIRTITLGKNNPDRRYSIAKQLVADRCRQASVEIHQLATRCKISQNVAALLWARIGAGFYVKCKEYRQQHKTHKGNRNYLTNVDVCEKCNGTGWVSEFFPTIRG